MFPLVTMTRDALLACCGHLLQTLRSLYRLHHVTCLHWSVLHSSWPTTPSSQILFMQHSLSASPIIRYCILMYILYFASSSNVNIHTELCVRINKLCCLLSYLDAAGKADAVSSLLYECQSHRSLASAWRRTNYSKLLLKAVAGGETILHSLSVSVPLTQTACNSATSSAFLNVFIYISVYCKFEVCPFWN